VKPAAAGKQNTFDPADNRRLQVPKSHCTPDRVTHPIFDTIYDGLLCKNLYPNVHFVHLAETRSGAVGVTADGVADSSGVYEGLFNVTLTYDANEVVREYAISASHPAPRHVQMIGLVSGSWGQVIAANQEVQDSPSSKSILPICN
jgi:hypothetical protein